LGAVALAEEIWCTSEQPGCMDAAHAQPKRRKGAITTQIAHNTCLGVCQVLVSPPLPCACHTALDLHRGTPSPTRNKRWQTQKGKLRGACFNHGSARACCFAVALERQSRQCL
jgi:hypothetical protein